MAGFAEEFEGGERIDAAEFERGDGRGIDAEFDGAGGAVTGFGDEIADGRVPCTEGIAEMFDANTEAIFEGFLAGEDFLARFLGGNVAQVWVGHGVRADFMSGGQPFAELNFVGKRFGKVAFQHVPIVLLTQTIRHDE